MSVLVVVALKPKEGAFQEVVDLLAGLTPAVHAEPGCELAAMYKVAGDDEIVMIEKYADQAAIEAHRANPVMADALARLGTLLASPMEAKFLEHVGLGGDSPKGSV